MLGWYMSEYMAASSKGRDRWRSRTGMRFNWTWLAQADLVLADGGRLGRRCAGGRRVGPDRGVTGRRA
jgi:hypothetical protein